MTSFWRTALIHFASLPSSTLSPSSSAAAAVIQQLRLSSSLLPLLITAFGSHVSYSSPGSHLSLQELPCEPRVSPQALLLHFFTPLPSTAMCRTYPISLFLGFLLAIPALSQLNVTLYSDLLCTVPYSSATANSNGSLPFVSYPAWPSLSYSQVSAISADATCQSSSALRATGVSIGTYQCVNPSTYVSNNITRYSPGYVIVNEWSSVNASQCSTGAEADQDVLVTNYYNYAPTICTRASVYLHGVLQPTFIYARVWQCNTNSGQSTTSPAAGLIMYSAFVASVLLFSWTL